MKNKQQLLQEQKQLRTKLAQVTKQINLQEVARMQQIAGVRPSKRFLKENFEEGDIVNFLNSNMDELESILGEMGSQFEYLGDEKVATAGFNDESGIDISFDKNHLLNLFPQNDPFNQVEEAVINGKKIYYVDYRQEENEEEYEYYKQSGT